MFHELKWLPVGLLGAATSVGMSYSGAEDWIRVSSEIGGLVLVVLSIWSVALTIRWKRRRDRDQSR